MAPPATVRFTLHGHGVALHLPDPDEPIQSRIAARAGFDSPSLLEDLRARVGRGDLCVDVGAHIGNHTIFLAVVCGARVLAVEPRPALYRALQQNIELNRVHDLVTAVAAPLGPSDRDDPAATWTLDEHPGAGRVALMRIGAAGFELEVLKGAARTIDRDRPALCVEARDARSREIIESYLSERGYVAVAEPAGTRVAVFVPCAGEEQRLTTLVHRFTRAQGQHAETLLGRFRDELRGNLDAPLSALSERLAHLEAQVTGLAGLLENLSRENRDQAALLYELWSLGAQSHARLVRSAERRGRELPDYRPLHREAADLAAPVRPRRGWSVGKGSEAGGFLQGYCTRLSAQAGEEVGFRLSTDEVALFARVRIFGPAAERWSGAAERWQELHSSPPVLVPRVGVWRPKRRYTGEQEWPICHSIRIDQSWRPGTYVVRFETAGGKAVLHHFWVTSAAPSGRAVQLASALSHAARNTWGKGNLHRPARRSWLLRARRPAAVRLHRPYRGSRGSPLLRAELALQQWAHIRRAPLDLVTDVDVHRRPELLEPYEQIVIAGDASHLTGPVLAALRRHRDAGGSIAVFGAAPGEFEVLLDLDAETIALRAQTAAERREWDRVNADLWSAGARWIQKEPLDLRFLPAAPGGGARLERAAVIPGLCVGRLSGSALDAGDPGLLARTAARSAEGERCCDAILVDHAAGGTIFVAGTDRWCDALDDAGPAVRDCAAVESTTARVLRVTAGAVSADPLVSIVIAARDRIQEVERAVHSFLSHAYSNLELIVVDDGSTDETFEMLLAWAESDRRLRPFKSFRSRGASWSWSYGLSKARGEFVAFREVDSCLQEEDPTAAQLDALRANPGAVAAIVNRRSLARAGGRTGGQLVDRGRGGSALMIRASVVLPRIGFFDPVLATADREYVRRLRVAFEPDQIVSIAGAPSRALRPGAPPIRPDREPADDRNLALAYEGWHRQIERGEVSPYLPFPLAARPFEAAAELAIDARPRADDTRRGALLTEVPWRRAVGRAIRELGEDLDEVWHLVNCEGLGEVDDAGVAVRTFKASAPGKRDARELAFTFTAEPGPGEEAVGSSLSSRAERCIVGIERAEERLQRLAGEDAARPSAPRPARGRCAREFDVILLSDFRFPGGTSQSNAEEIKAQAQLGFSTGLLQFASPVIRQDRPIHAAIERCADEGLAEHISPGRSHRAKLVVIRHPTLLMRERREMPRIEAEQVAVIINQPPVDAQSGRSLYDLGECQARVRDCFGVPGAWFPIGPLVRKAIEGQRVETAIADEDWTNIINLDEWRTPRTAFASDRPVIGRHSRDSADKWPDSAEDLLRAYPMDPAIKVRILGGAESARKLIGRLPDSWTVLPFGSIGAREFLAGIDFFVYYHHSRWIEAFGRSILEAMATGVPAILPPHFAELFGPAAIYREPAGVRDTVLDLHGDRSRYEEWSGKGIALVEDRFSYAAHARRLERMGCRAASSPGEGSVNRRTAAGPANAF